MELHTEIKKEYRSFETWTEQLLNIFSSVFWFVGICLAETVLVVGSFCIAFTLIYKGESYTITELQQALKRMVVLSSMSSVLMVGIFGLPRRLRNVFKEIAGDRLQRYSSIKEQFEMQVQTTDDLLLKYGLITQREIDVRKNMRVGSE